jgi:hypothetical protein
MFMTGRVRMLTDAPDPLEKQRQPLYIYQNGHFASGHVRGW